MKKPAIYFVGKPYPFKEARDAIKQMGFNAGVLLDKSVKLKFPDRYDSIIQLDFSTPQTMLEDLSKHHIEAAGLVCAYEGYVVAKSYIAEKLWLPSIGIDQAKTCTDKLLMRQAFMRANPKITPNFGLATNKQELLELAETLQYPLIIKPTNLVKSLLVMRCNNQDELVRNFEYAIQNIGKLYEKFRIYDRQPQLIVEEFITGKMYTVAAFVGADGKPHLCKGIAELITAQEINQNDNYLYARHLPARLDQLLEQKIIDTAIQGIESLGLRSVPAHVELIYNGQDVKIIEIGARIGGYRPRMYQLSYGIDLFKAEVMLAIGKTPELSSEFKAYSGVYELFPDKEGIFQGLDGSVHTDRFVSFSVKARQGDLVGPARNGFKATAVAVLQAPEEHSFADLQEQINHIKVRVA